MTAPGETLSGKTVALVALGRDLLIDATTALDRVGAVWQAASGADPAALRSADIAVVTVAAAPALAKAGIPLLIVGALAEFARNDEYEAHHDFILAPPLHGDELLLRGAHLLAAPSPRARRVDEKPVVLAADDDPTTTAIVRAVVTQNGMTCHVASDGKAAIEMARKTRPTVVVLDVNMPFHDGFEVLSALRQMPETSSTAVVMLTSVQQEADVVRAFSLGADDYVVKPFNPMELLARIKRLVMKES
jgi:CheY-like chemotaxis protein